MVFTWPCLRWAPRKTVALWWRELWCTNNTRSWFFETEFLSASEKGKRLSSSKIIFHILELYGVLFCGRLASIQLPKLPLVILMIQSLLTSCTDCLTFKRKFYWKRCSCGWDTFFFFQITNYYRGNPSCTDYWTFKRTVED